MQIMSSRQKNFEKEQMGEMSKSDLKTDYKL